MHLNVNSSEIHRFLRMRFICYYGAPKFERLAVLAKLEVEDVSLFLIVKLLCGYLCDVLFLNQM